MPPTKRAPLLPVALAPQPNAAESLTSLLNPEWLDGDNAYFCEHCQKKVRTARCACCARCGARCGAVAFVLACMGVGSQRLLPSRACLVPVSQAFSSAHRLSCPPTAPPPRQVTAKRQLELRQLPPVLCFSLQRFVFDFQVGQRSCPGGCAVLD